jgi:hypothetical protein
VFVICARGAFCFIGFTRFAFEVALETVFEVLLVEVIGEARARGYGYSIDS